jgi:hypothetical protein
MTDRRVTIPTTLESLALAAITSTMAVSLAKS